MNKKRNDNNKLAKVADCMDNALREENEQLATMYNALKTEYAFVYERAMEKMLQDRARIEILEADLMEAEQRVEDLEVEVIVLRNPNI